MNRFGNYYCTAIILALCLASSLPGGAQDSSAQDSPVQVQLNTNNAGPRTIESLTEQAILRDYRSAWSSMAHALEFNILDPINQPFAGDARQVLRDSVTSQQTAGLRQRFLEQNHKLEVVFYAPEGEVIELHDTAEYQRQVMDRDKVVQDQHVVVRYVVLMTPAADRWVIRQLQAVAKF